MHILRTGDNRAFELKTITYTYKELLVFYFSAIVDCSVHITWENTFLGTEDLLLEIYTFLLSKREKCK